jgi:SpoVK/Ycf46/Vps4 family AAA+-type ATPase
MDDWSIWNSSYWMVPIHPPPHPQDQNTNFMAYLQSVKYMRNLNKDQILTFLYQIDHHYMTYIAEYEPVHPYPSWSFLPPPPEAPYPVYENTAEETDEILKSLVLPPPPQQIEKRHIDVNIETIQDLLDVIDANPDLPNVEYNIDLKLLHNIRKELGQINDMIGLKTFKANLLDQLLYFVQGLHENTEHDYKHLIIYGPPGTGKSQIAKLVGQMYAKLGTFKNSTGVFKKVTRADLVAGYLGQTAIKTEKVVKECLGGVLFIDEAYTLGCGVSGTSSDPNMEDGEGGSRGDNFSKECIDTLCEALSNYKDDLMVIIAGYEKDIQHQFLSLNPGLSSRFIWRLTIDDYSAAELQQIFMARVKDNGWSWVDGIEDEVTTWFSKKCALGAFKYFGRDMEQLFTYCKIAHGRRVYGRPIEERRRFTIADLDRGYEIFMKHADAKQKETKKMPEQFYGLYC